MSLLIVFLIIYGLKLHYGLYVGSVVLYLSAKLIRIRILQETYGLHDELIKKIDNLSINTTEEELLNEKDKKNLKRFLKDLQ